MSVCNECDGRAGGCYMCDYGRSQVFTPRRASDEYKAGWRQAMTDVVKTLREAATHARGDQLATARVLESQARLFEAQLEAHKKSAP